MDYKLQLQTEEWKAKKQEILKRDKKQCQTCLSKLRLCIHHKKYISGLLAWEYENDYLITLCHYCHKAIHQYNRKMQPKKKAPNLTYTAKDKAKEKAKHQQRVSKRRMAKELTTNKKYW